MKTVQIENNYNYHRDINTHAVINTNSSEYEAYLRQRSVIENAKTEATKHAETIKTMEQDISELKQLVSQLISRG